MIIEGLTFFKLLHIIFGIAFVMFIPGILLTLVLFKKMDWLERFALGFGLSISITIFTGLIFTFPNDNRISAMVGGIKGVLPALVIISVIFFLIYFLINWKVWFED